MSRGNIPKTPRVWTDFELEREAQVALDEFVNRRLAEPSTRYLHHIVARRTTITRLFKTLSGINSTKPDPERIRAVLLDEELFDALRYVAGPPVSEDDLGVLVTRHVRGINKTMIREDAKIPAAILALICRLADPVRFPWIVERRKPTQRELRNAIETTAVMHASQALETERRGHGKEVEKRLEARLIELGFRKVSGKTPKPKAADATAPAYPPNGRVTQPSHHPTYPHFYGECVVYGRKVDQFIALATGRMVALEAKDSSSALNSKKRLNNDTAAKAKHYTTEAGKNIISVALLSGVFALADLKAAQEAGLYLVWSHDLDSFLEWIKLQTR